MPQLIVRNLDEELVSRLKKRAGEHGVSTEEEHRRILRSTLMDETEKKPSFKDHLLTVPNFEDEALFERDRTVGGRASDHDLFEE